jgi:hypothetical protein
MTELTFVISLVTLLVGWLLGEASNRRRELSSDRRAISRAIADLLEVRNRTFFLKACLDEVAKRFKVPDEARPIMATVLDAFLPNTELLQKRYNDSIDALASTDPVLGFRFRSKDELPKLLKTLRELVSQDPNSARLYPHFEKQLMELIKSPMEEAILELAKAHGWRTRRKVKAFLNESIVDQTQLDNLLSTIQGMIQQPANR